MLAKSRGILFGSAIRSRPLADDSAYAAFAASQFSILTPENDFKFDAIHPEQERFEFKAADQIVAFAKKNRQLIRGHTLVWHNPDALPEWLKSRDWSPQELRQILTRHIETTLGHFNKTAKGIVVSWDVLNEAFDDEGSFRKDSIWARIEPDPFKFFSWLFRLCHRIAPGLKLYYNDYGIEAPGKKTEVVLRIMKRLRAAKIPIDGIGFQTHGSADWNSDFETLATTLKRFAKLGLRVHITEMDYAIRDAAPQDSQLQAQAYSKALEACLSVKNCGVFITWGFTDRYLWNGNFKKGSGSSTYLDRDLKPKPALESIRKILNPD